MMLVCLKSEESDKTSAERGFHEAGVARLMDLKRQQMRKVRQI
jgi:hypothetical protein